MRSFILFLLLVANFLCAEEEGEEANLSYVEKIAPNLVHGCVCVITGAYVDSSVDLVLPGPATLKLERRYHSRAEKGGLGLGWAFTNFDALATMDQGVSNQTKHYKSSQIKSDIIKLGQLSNLSAVYSKAKSGYSLDSLDGCSNLSGPFPTALTNVKNQSMRVSRDKDKIYIRTPSQEIRTFTLSKKYSNPIKEDIWIESSRADENENGFTFKKGDNITEMGWIGAKNLKSDKRFSHVRFKELSPSVLEGTASNGRSIVYTFEKEGDARRLKSVDKPFGPKETYSYQGSKLVKKELPDGRFLQISYYSEKEHTRSKNKVRGLYAPVGVDGHTVKIYTFEYGKKETKVINAYGAETLYSYSSKGRLSRIEHKCEERLYKTEEFFWGKHDDEGNLTGKVLRDHKGKITQGLFFEYDSKGNVLTKTLAGNLTGKNKISPALKHDFIEQNGCETEKVTYTYTSANLPRTEKHSNGLSYKHKYDKSRPWLLTAKYTLDHDQIKKREFFEHNDYGLLICKIEDDGSEESSSDLSNVSQRLVTRFSLEQEIPVGLPFLTEEYYTDLTTGQERILKKKLSRFSPEGKLLELKIYGADDVLYEARSYTYDAKGNLIEEVDPLGQVTKKEYDANSNLVREEKGGLVFEMAYDLSDRLVTKLERHPDGNAFPTHYHYTHLSQCSKTIDPYGRVTEYEYDQVGRATKKILPAALDEKGAVFKPTESVKYNSAGYPIFKTDTQGNTTTTEFNIRGSPTKISYPDGTEETFVYNLQGQLLEKTEINGVKTVFTRDYQGRVLSQTVFGSDKQELSWIHNTYNAFHLLSSLDSEGLLTTYTYDSAGRLVTLKKGTEVTTHFYDSIGRLAKIEEQVDEATIRVTLRFYDALDRVIEERIESPSGEILNLDKFSYDPHGNKTMVQHGESISHTLFNGFHQPIKIVDGAGHATHITYDYETCDTLGQRVLRKTTTDPVGYITEELHDALDRLVAITKRTPFGQEIWRKEMLYDTLNREAAVKNFVITAGKVDHIVTHLFEYNLFNQLEKETLAANTPEQSITRFSYDKRGQKILKIKPDGTKLHFSYDSKGRLATLSSSDGTLSTQYAYNSKDQMTSTLQNNALTTLSYDQNGRLVQETLGNGLIVSYAYDNAGRTRKIVLPDSSSIEYLYDPLNLKAIHRIKNGQIAYSHYDTTHNLIGGTTVSTLANGLAVHTTYDSLYRCTSLQSSAFTQTATYNPIGNITSLQTNQEEFPFTYDDLSQLISEKEMSYSNDSLSNRLSKNGEVYRYNNLNQLISQGETTYTYDPNGNLIQKATPQHSITYTYDPLDRLIAITENGQKTTYTYDSSNRRICQVLPSGTLQKFLFIGQEEVGLFENDVCTELKILSKGQRHPSVALEIRGITYVPLHDLFGNTVSLLSMQGELLQSFRYTAFGELTQGPENPLTPWLFSNKRRDASGLYHFGLRFYDPHIGRWLSPDPAGFTDGQNLYAYVHNNPLLYFDEQGLFALWDGLQSLFSATYDVASLCALSLLDFSPPQVFCTNDLIDPNTNMKYNLPENPIAHQVLEHGVLNQRKTFEDSLVAHSMNTGYNTVGVYVPTRGIIGDAVIYLAELMGYRSRGSLLLQKTMEELSSDKPILLTAHSRGCVSARNALIATTTEVQQHTYYTAVCPGGYTERKHCKEVVHLCGSADPVPYLDFVGRARCQDTIHEIKRHPDAPYFDHSFTSPTFKGPIQDLFKEYQRQIGGLRIQ